MLTIQDIRVVTFDKERKGYNVDDVDAFLSQVADQMETAQKEKEETEKKLYLLAEKVAEYRKDEDNLKSALLNAQRLGENVIQEANQRAERIVREANEKAELNLAATEHKIQVGQLELARIQEEVGHFKESILDLYKQHIESLSTLPDLRNEEDAESTESAESASPVAPAMQPEPEQAPVMPEMPSEVVSHPESNNIENLFGMGDSQQEI